ncbi:MAG: family 10 glycosylhydrolase, partial [Phycisphaerae bacterium]|nr:family 10 glycosylhydrolase [Phycisphaerae bacterium]
MLRNGIGLFAVVAVLALLTGCVGPRVDGPVRAIWVTRYDYKTADDVKQIINNCANAGFNSVLFQVRGNGNAFYKSSFEPWADELGGKDPGFDPLALACQQAHARGIELHAWVNVMPGWDGTKPPTNPEQLYSKHPDWFWYDQNGKRQELTDFYVSVNPCLPEVREYLVAVFRDIVSHYDVDGLHMDYIRFPNEPPAIPARSGIDYPRDARTLALYKKATGLAPDDDPEAWNKWRTDQVTQLVADIHKMMRWTKPKAALSASVGSVPESALRHFQDGRAWMSAGLLDLVFLMNYTDSPEEFSQRIDPWLAAGKTCCGLGCDRCTAPPIAPGLWFGRHPGKSTEEISEAVKRQIEIAHEKTGNFCIFAYSSLFATHRDSTARAAEGGDKVRAT